ncbi:MAG: hypothetical protein R2830_00485 [Saprospiraceae bacterium]
MSKDRFVIVEKECLHSLKIETHPVEGGKCFVPASVLKTAWEENAGSETTAFYLPISFPESQLFMEEHWDEIHLINDEDGIGRYGYAAYFVEEGLYKKTLADFDNEKPLITPEDVRYTIQHSRLYPGLSDHVLEIAYIASVYNGHKALDFEGYQSIVEKSEIRLNTNSPTPR